MNWILWIMAGAWCALWTPPPADRQVVACHAVAPQADALAHFAMQLDQASFVALHNPPTPLVLEQPMGGMIMYHCADGQPGRGYLLQSKNGGKDLLIVIQEWWGLNDHIKAEAEKYYTALGENINVLAVDLYDGKVATTTDSARKYISQALQSNRKEALLEGALNYAQAGARIFTVGWCFGGMMSLQTAIMGGSRVAGCIMYYGQPERSVEKIAKLQCDVLGIFGTQDRGIPNESVDEFATKMKEAGKSFTLVRYDAVHAFANPGNPGYQAAFAEDAFAKSIDFIQKKRTE